MCGSWRQSSALLAVSHKVALVTDPDNSVPQQHNLAQEGRILRIPLGQALGIIRFAIFQLCGFGGVQRQAYNPTHRKHMWI